MNATSPMSIVVLTTFGYGQVEYIEIEIHSSPESMIACPVCHTDNDNYATVCTHCKAFLQNRIPNLNLFETAWKVLESPRAAFHDITIAEHKNYSLFLFSLFGIPLAFTNFWYLRVGDRFQSLLDLIIWAFIIGAGAGLVLGLLLTSVYHLGVRLMGGKSDFRSSLGLLSYSLIPVVFTLVFVLPVELLTFGMYLFTSNPHPYTIKPFSYVALVGFDVAISLWALVLAVLGTAIGHQISPFKSVVVVALTLCVLGGVFFLSPRALPMLR